MAVSSRKAPPLPKSKRRQPRPRAARKARQTRWQTRRHFDNLPAQARSFFETFTPAFRRPTFLRFALLALAALLTVGSRTVCNVLRTAGLLAPGDPPSCHRFFSARRRPLIASGRRLAGWILDRLVPTGPVYLAADDTVDEHPGDKVCGKGCHRDAVRSSRSHTAFRRGHRWLVVFVPVAIPGASRRRALPLFVILCHSATEDNRHGRRHRTPAQRLLRAMLVPRRRFPGREFVLAADGGFASRALTGGVARRVARTTYVSRSRANAALYDPPPAVVLQANGKRPTAGRSRVKGDKRDTPEQVAARTGERMRLRVSRYGGEDRHVEVASATGHWYKAGQGSVRVRWVYVRGASGTHRDGYFYGTDERVTARGIIEAYARRWNAETTFQEMRSHTGLETTRGWKKETVPRAAPCPFGMYSAVVCLYLMTPRKYRDKPGVQWTGKQGRTFSDALTCVRKWPWVEWVFAPAGQEQTLANLPEDFQGLLLNGPAPAA